jgi:ribosomal protein L40E
MTSSKCKQCGLVNPIHASVCKRCSFPLTAGVTLNPSPETDNRTMAAKDEQPGMPVIETSAPAVCSICGANDNVVIRSLQRTYTPNWVWLFLPLGILPAGIIALAVQVKHTLLLPLCMRCNQRRSWAGVVSWFSIIACIFLIFMAIGLGVAFKSWLFFLGVCGLIAAIAYASGRYERGVNPRFTQFTKERVEIEVPGRGRLLVLDRANQRVQSR